MIDWSLILTIGAIFALTLVGAYLRSTVKDRCLKSFVDFPVTLELASGKTAWGVLHLAPTGMELQYADAVQDEQHIESSYVLYAPEYQSVQAIYRYASQLCDEDRDRREEDVQQAFHPRPLRRLARDLRNFMSTATESVNDVLNVAIGRVRLTAGSQTSISRLTGQAIGQVGAEHDPILERFIGSRVVLELMEDSEVHEHVGIFQEYSGQFLLLLDVSYPQKEIIKVKASSAGSKRKVKVEEVDGSLQITNLCDQPVLLHSLSDGKNEQLVNAVIGGDETANIFPALSIEDANLVFRTVREVDMIVPRSRAMIRHRAEHFKEESMKEVMLDFIFDVGVIFSDDKRLKMQEERLREQLELDPNDIVAAANLGAVLIKQGEYIEAEKWLTMALAHSDELPDGGRRAQMEMRELQRRQASSGVTHA